MLQLLLSDLRAKARWCFEDESIVAVLKTLATDGTPAMICYRLMQGCRRYRLVPLEFLFNKLIVICCGCVIGRGAEFGPGFVLIHSLGTVINGRVRGGSHVYLEHQVTIGDGADRNVIPTIGDHVYIGAGAKVLASVGSFCRVGANAVVVKPVPDRTTAVGIPARFLPNRHAPAAGTRHEGAQPEHRP